MRGKLLIEGKGASKGVAVGGVRVVNGDEAKIAKVETGDIVVADKLRPEHDIYMKKAAAFVTNTGGVTAHAAIVAREWGLPAIVGTMGSGYDATTELKEGQEVVVDGGEGTVHEYIGPPLAPGVKAPTEPTPTPSTMVDKMAQLAEKRGVKLDPAFLEKLKKKG